MENVVTPPPRALLKWVGSKYRFAREIVSYFPRQGGGYIEPFLGSGAVLATLAPDDAIGGDSFGPLIEVWKALKASPDLLKQWYAERWELLMSGEKVKGYEKIKAAYNAKPNGADLLFLCRACYGGVVRFRKSDGYMSTPCGIHNPISPKEFNKRVDDWHSRVLGTQFLCADYEQTMGMAKSGDLIYCDPPYFHSQKILYGSQSFDITNLCEVIARCKQRGVRVALSIDGTKRSGDKVCEIPIPIGLFKREISIHCGRSMLKRFQMNGRTLEREVVADRLLLTY